MSKRKSPKLVRSQPLADLPHVCPWCAQRFALGYQLRQHWIDTPICNRNRKVSNQTQSKYKDVDQETFMPGEQVLEMVRQHEPDDEG